MSFIQFIKNWSLPIAMLAGACSYLIYNCIPALKPIGSYLEQGINILQPTLIFAMLFITFCKINVRELRPRRWHLWLILIQCITFSLLALSLVAFPETKAKVIIEGAMLCMICPTATAAAVVAGKLGGNTTSLTTYIILINIATACVVPFFVPLIHPQEGLTFTISFSMILSKVFPLLLFPLLCAIFVKKWLPSVTQIILKCKDLAFYIWLFALAIAIALTTKSIIHSDVSIVYQLGIAGISLFCCVAQFLLGKLIGRHYNDEISAGQSLGQKNTIFAIWMAYTFMTPVTSIAGGFYSVWHNLYNSYQLYRTRKVQKSEKA